MAKDKRGMDAVIAKSSKMGGPRKPIMQRKGKGPGMAIMIAIGKPKPDIGEKPKSPSLREELDASKGEGLSKSEKIAALEEKIGYLNAELALLKGEKDESDEMDEMDNEMEDETEDEDEYEED